MEKNENMTIEELAGRTQKGFIDVETRLNERIEELAVMTQKGFIDVETRLTEKIVDVETRLTEKMTEMQTGLTQLVTSVLKVVENIERRMDEIHTVGRVDVPDLRNRVEILETDREKVKEKVKIPA